MLYGGDHMQEMKALRQVASQHVIWSPLQDLSCNILKTSPEGLADEKIICMSPESPCSTPFSGLAHLEIYVEGWVVGRRD